MSQIAPAALLHLREADVVRLCGLEAAARGLDAVARHAVLRPRRENAQLEATVEIGQPRHVWIDASDGQSMALRLGCDCPDMSGATPGSLGCEHVAAILTAWIRTPAMFSVPPATTPIPGDTRTTSSRMPPQSDNLTQPLEHITQPKLLSPRPAKRPRDGLTLAYELARLSAHDLLDLARRVLSIDPSKESDTQASHEPPNLDELRLLLAAHLRDSRKLSLLLDRLDASARLLLSDIATMGGAITSADLDALAERGNRSSEALRAGVAVLTRYGLLFHVPGAQSLPASGTPARGNISGWRVPSEILTVLHDILPLTLPALPTRDAYGPPLVTRPGESSPALRSARVVRASPALLLLTLALLAHAPRPFNPLAPHAPSTPPAIPPGPAPRESKRSAIPSHQSHHAGARAFPLVPGDLAPHVIAEFARSANVPTGLARLARRTLLWARDGDSQAALLDLATLPASERVIALRSAFQIWRSAEVPVELADLAPDNAPVRLRLDHTHEALRPAILAAEAREARSTVLRLLRRLATDSWHSFDDLLDLLWRLCPLFLRARQQTYSAPAWWLERSDDRRPLRPTVPNEWRAAEGEYIRALLAGPLHWFGIFDLAHDAATPTSTTGPTTLPTAFRLTPVGRYLLSDDRAAAQHEAEARVSLASLTPDWGAPLVPTREGHLAVQPLAATNLDLLATVSGWARPSAIAGRRVIYALAPDLACEMFNCGVAPDVLLAYLRAIDSATGPRAAASIEPQLRAWHTAYGRSRIETGWTLIEAQDEATLVEALATVPDLVTRCRRLAPSIALVPADAAPTLEATLTRRGYAV
ncbi:MAG: hypothetical protein ACXWQ5_11445 [Ktedonobacterales bacterium]